MTRMYGMGGYLLFPVPGRAEGEAVTRAIAADALIRYPKMGRHLGFGLCNTEDEAPLELRRKFIVTLIMLVRVDAKHRFVIASEPRRKAFL